MIDMLPREQRQQLEDYRADIGYHQPLAPQRARAQANPQAQPDADPAPATTAPDAAHAYHAHNFADQIGTQAQVVGLVTPGGMEINGCIGTVIGYPTVPVRASDPGNHRPPT